MEQAKVADAAGPQHPVQDHASDYAGVSGRIREVLDVLRQVFSARPRPTTLDQVERARVAATHSVAATHEPRILYTTVHDKCQRQLGLRGPGATQRFDELILRYLVDGDRELETRLEDHVTSRYRDADLRAIRWLFAGARPDAVAAQAAAPDAPTDSVTGATPSEPSQGVRERPTPPQKDYAGLLQQLATDGLCFPPETVSNYLLALQTKRFVILSGISGTGKTRLAIAVAWYFRPMVGVAAAMHVPVGAHELKVAPYMVKYHQMVLPTALAVKLTPSIFGEKETGTIEVLYPEGGRADLTIFRQPERDVVRLLFRDDFRSWFLEHLKPSDTFFLDIEVPSDDTRFRLRFSVPSLGSREEPLDNYRVVAVRSDWTDNRGLLGYYNPLTERYVTTPFLELLLRASEECERAKSEGRPPHPFFIVLDEMNLARVEHYFSDFLSCLESGEALHLHEDARIEAGESEDAMAVPRELEIPANVFFTGTVNVDETTYMFSPKVLDRAFTLELHEVDLAGYGTASASGQASMSSPLSLHRLPAQPRWRSNPDADDWRAFGDLLGGRLRAVVVELNRLLATEHRHFGYRVANEIARFVTLAAKQAGEGTDPLWAALDLAVLQKVLPKFHGTQQELESVLGSLFAFAIDGTPGGHERSENWALEDGALVRQNQVTEESTPAPRLPRTAAKVWRMLRRLQQQGFTSFME